MDHSSGIGTGRLCCFICLPDKMPIITYGRKFYNCPMNNSDFKLNHKLSPFLDQSAIVFENPGWSRERIEIHAVRKDYYGGINSISSKVIIIKSRNGLFSSSLPPCGARKAFWNQTCILAW